MSMIYMLPMSISFSLMTLLLLLSMLNFKKKSFLNKMNSFECGFSPIAPPRGAFSMQFFKILMIFLLFDMEILIILPLPVFHFPKILNLYFLILIMFLVIFSLYFEWKEGSLNWLK